MRISLSIAQARKALQMTQEEVAEALGVSHVAVSKWERGVSYPDITLLPAIARLFHMSLDDLFSYQERLTSEEAVALTKQVLENFQSMSLQEALSKCKDIMKQYPNDMQLMKTVGSSLWRGLMYAESEEGMMPVILYAQELLLKVKNSDDKLMHDHACASLSQLYLMQDKMEEALQVLDEIEEEHIDAQQLKAGIYMNQKKYEEATELYEAIMLRNIMNVRMCMTGISTMAMMKKDEEAVLKIVEQIEALLDLFDIKLPLSSEYLQCVRVCERKQDHQATREYLIKCLRSLSVKVAHPAFPTMNGKQKVSMQTQEENSRNFLRVLLEDPLLQAYRQDPEIMTLIEKIQEA